MDLYAELLHRVFFPTWEGLVRRRPTVRLLKYLEQTQWRSLDELQAIQLGSLRRLLRHSYDNIPFWRKQLAGPSRAERCLDFAWSLLTCREFVTNH